MNKPKTLRCVLMGLGPSHVARVLEALSRPAIGLMGSSCTAVNVTLLLAALGDCLGKRW
jgi:hypothetical protein